MVLKSAASRARLRFEWSHHQKVRYYWSEIRLETGMPRTSTTWRPGCASPNPGGRPKALHDLQELAREHTPEAIETLVKIMRNDNHPQQGWAADKLLDRGWGRPIVPTVQTTTGKTFEEWLDTLNDEAKRLLEEGTAFERWVHTLNDEQKKRGPWSNAWPIAPGHSVG